MEKLATFLFVVLLVSTLLAAQQSKVETFKLPAERSAQLKSIQERQDLIAKEYQQLDAQKLIVVQRAALELHLTAEQLDTLRLEATADGFVLKTKPVETATKPPAAANP